MGLLPLEFSDCLLDSPYFRENLRAHERQLERASEDVKCVARCVREVAEAARSLSAAKRALAAALEAASASFECGGLSGSGGGGGGGANNGLTDDEVIIANSLREFASFFNQVRVIFRAHFSLRWRVSLLRFAHVQKSKGKEGAPETSRFKLTSKQASKKVCIRVPPLTQHPPLFPLK